MTKSASGSQSTRRVFIKRCIGTAAGLLVLPRSGLTNVRRAPERSLTFLNLHTGEELHTVYWSNGAYQVSELQAISHILRDHRTDEQHLMDRRLMDLLFALQQSVGIRSPFEVVSGYRSPATNAELRAVSSGVAKHSLHMQGKAIDICVTGFSLKKLHDAAVALKAGGVGYYPKSNFIHVDTGPVRYW